MSMGMKFMLVSYIVARKYDFLLVTATHPCDTFEDNYPSGITLNYLKML